MPWISDRDWQRMQEALIEGVHTRGERRDQHVLKKIDTLIQQMEKLMATQSQIRDKLTALLANVADSTSKLDGIEKLLANLSTMIKTLQDQIANQDVPQDISDSVDAIGAAVDQGKQRILDDINKNTQPEPAASGAKS